MSEWGLLFILCLLSFLALALVLFPLRSNKKLKFILPPFFIAFLAFNYWQWGSWTELRDYLANESKRKKIEAVLQTIKGPSELIERMHMRLKKDPQNGRAWYLLGKLEASQGQWSKARDAFFKAQQLIPEDELVVINYAESLWQLNPQENRLTIKTLLIDLIQKNPNQPDALAMLARDAYLNQEYSLAMEYWQRLLKLAPENSEDAQLLRKAIAKAQQKLIKKF